MNKRKILNDPVYGFITIPYEILFDLIEHPYFQRLRRIKQLGLSDYVYPNANHTRFSHAIGSVYLMQKAIHVLRRKGIPITVEEAEAVTIAILLHDIGHAPFSHALEREIISNSHEQLSFLFIEILNEQLKGKLDLAKAIFSNQYEKQFLYQLVSSQIDMDRLDYLARDSFFTGVAEGVIGYDRIIEMLMVVEDQIVIEEKGLHSIERFLLSRHFMYWQVYLHKTVIAAEQMLRKYVRLIRRNAPEKLCPGLFRLWNDQELSPHVRIELFSGIDDYDIISLLKRYTPPPGSSMEFLSKGLLNRKLFKTIFKKSPFAETTLEEIRNRVRSAYPGISDVRDLVLTGIENNTPYAEGKDTIRILTKDQRIVPFSALAEHVQQNEVIEMHYICHPALPD